MVCASTFLPSTTAESHFPFTKIESEMSYQAISQNESIPDAARSRIATLRSLPTIRRRCSKVHQIAQRGGLDYFDYHPENESTVVDFCLEIMKRDYSDFAKIPAHGRWRHFDVERERINPLLNEWQDVSTTEKCARLLDLFLVSVLLDAGAGNQWKYTEKDTGSVYTRSEGLAIASLDMFKAGMFSSNPQQPYQVDAKGLAALKPEAVAEAMQVSSTNPMNGIAGRTSLLISLSSALLTSPQYFGSEGRPGSLITYLKNDSRSSLSEIQSSVHIAALWDVVMLGLAPIWPKDRTNIAGVPMGDVWKCDSLAKEEQNENGDGLVPFHKLSQWLTYSLVEPIEKILGWKFQGMEDMTGLPEYRNGGLLVDLGVLIIKKNALGDSFYPDPNSSIPLLPPSHPAVIEWRAMTVIELDRIAAQICEKTDIKLSLPQVLEAATWKGGREIAKKLRAANSGPPIEIQSDGTVF